MDSFVRDTAPKNSIILRDAAGTLTDATGNVTVEIRDSAEVVVVASSIAPKVSTGKYEFTVPTSVTAVLDTYETTWTYTLVGTAMKTRRSFIVVGGFFFSIARARAHDNGRFKDESKFPTQDIIDAREGIETDLESNKACGVAWVRRGRRETHDGDGSDELFVQCRPLRKVVAVKVDGVALDVSALAGLKVYPGGWIKRAAGWPTGDRNIEVLYEHGHDEPPGRIADAALILLKERLGPSNYDDRTLTVTDDLGTRRLAVAGEKYTFGIPEVDAAVAQHRETDVVFA